MGYGSFYIILNFGTLCWLVLVTPFIWLISIILKVFDPTYFENVIRRSSQLMFWNGWIRFLDENYLFLGVCCAINLHYLRFDSFGNMLNSLVTVIVTGLCLLFPIFVGLFYSRGSVMSQILDFSSDFHSKFGAIIEGLNFKR
jgi:hypothetical protein